MAQFLCILVVYDNSTSDQNQNKIMYDKLNFNLKPTY